KRKLEYRRGVSLVGPHRDDFSFSINENELRRFGSRGQHKTVLIASKLSEYSYLKIKNEETPIILFDDLFSDLDSMRISKIIEKLDHVGQVFITTTRAVEDDLDSKMSYMQFEVRENQLRSTKR
ncbi:DNA replication and repair protein RecF, partial [candidate division KSB1 bacterium]|nr:DNA replication and repair protein RecF [candidate division KSB1 bacterium]